MCQEFSVSHDQNTKKHPNNPITRKITVHQITVRLFINHRPI